MKRAILVCSGQVDRQLLHSSLQQSDSVLIAVDGGGNHLAELEILPDIAVGDFDSLNSEILLQYRKSSAKILEFPEDKDATDLELAFDLLVAAEIDSFELFGGWGGDPDHLLGNIGLLTLYAPKFSEIKIWDNRSFGKLFFGPKKAEILQDCKALSGSARVAPQKISLVPLSQLVTGVTLTGCRWSLRNETLTIGSTRSLRNEISESQVTLEFGEGILMVWVLE